MRPVDVCTNPELIRIGEHPVGLDNILTRQGATFRGFDYLRR